MKVSEVAKSLGVSPRRVRQLIEDNSIVAHQSDDGVWDIDPRSLIRGLPVSRPLSKRSVEAMLQLLDGRQPQGISASEVSRIRSKIRSLRDNPDAAIKLISWMASRSVEYRLSISPSLLEALRSDNRLKLSGISHPESDMSSFGMVEAYVSDDSFDGLVADYQLVPGGFDGNVILRIRDEEDVSLPLVMIDLLEGLDSRSRDRGLVLLEGMIK